MECHSTDYYTSLNNQKFFLRHLCDSLLAVDLAFYNKDIGYKADPDIRGQNKYCGPA